MGSKLKKRRLILEAVYAEMSPAQQLVWSFARDNAGYEVAYMDAGGLVRVWRLE